MEPNAMPGLVSRLTARWVRHALVSFDETERWFPAGKSERTGLPVRTEFFDIPPAAQGDTFHVLMTGGSRGAQSLNRAAAAAWPILAQSGAPVSVTLQCGQNDADHLRQALQFSGLPGEVVPFIDDMPAAYASAHLIVSRSGAGAVSEIAAAGRPSILVPFPFAADDHQKHNAQAMVRAGASVMIEDRDLTGERLAGEILRIAADPAAASAMGANARSLARPGASWRAAELLERCAAGIDRPAGPPEQ
jgi:UDP-N-acetylglucosamine--N-acetylmuramyl-(pentapeptide) pyrophosphoryl-undecaprenol N-acetylglucosamine transferase